MTTIGHLINGETRQDTGRTQDVYNPATGEVSKQVSLASKETVEEAIAAAAAAFPSWRSTPVGKRTAVTGVISKSMKRDIFIRPLC